ncbi:hypothetical protein GGS26DRAFT_603324 [Hypomontagnella submonticulosa]|nr:hypothetical protein GGS26DRAFT_603324 [Hypomontagnella submonticulosa]
MAREYSRTRLLDTTCDMLFRTSIASRDCLGRRTLCYKSNQNPSRREGIDLFDSKQHHQSPFQLEAKSISTSTMQFKGAVLFLSVVPAAMAILPTTVELLVFQNGQRIGCVNGYGKFTTSTAARYPFRTRDIEGSDDKYLWAFGYGTCSTESSVIDCYEPEGAPAAFTHNSADLELVDSGTGFSANSIPSSDDTKGVDIIVGNGGSEQFSLQVRGLSG